jgi:L-fuculose-phosphate aldolase
MVETYSLKFSIPEGAITHKSILTVENKGLIRAMKKAGREIAERGIAAWLAGDLSARTESGFLITAAQCDLSGLSDEDFVHVEAFDATGSSLVKASGLKNPSPETPMHALIYEKRPDIRAVIHVHDPTISRPGVAEKLRLPSTPAGAAHGTREASEAVAELAGRSDFIVISGHGAVALGKTVEECTEKANLFHRRAGAKV